MWEEYKTTWKRNYSDQVEGRTGLRVWFFFSNVLVATILIFASWFVPLILFAKLAVTLDLITTGEALQVTTVTMYGLALVQLLVFSCTKIGDRLLTALAKKLERAILDVFMPPLRVMGAPAATKMPEQQDTSSHIPSSPYVPPRADLA